MIWRNHTKHTISMIAAIATVTLSAVAVASGGDASGSVVIPWGDLIEAIVNFAILVAILVYFLKAPIKTFFENRSREIGSALDEAKRLREEAQAKLDEYAKRLGEFEAEKEGVLERYRKEAAEDRDAIIADAKEQAERMRRDAKTAVEHEVIRAQKELRGQIVLEAIAQARKRIEKRLDARSRSALVDEYIVQLGEVKGGLH